MILSSVRKVEFRLQQKTEYGQDLYVIGSTAELGGWKEFKNKMKWTEGHIWTISLDLVDPQFEYKYVIKTGKELKWEPGPNRVCVMSELKDPVIFGTS